MAFFNCHPVSKPAFPDLSSHHLWKVEIRRIELKNQGIVLSSDTTQSMHLKKDSNIQLRNYLLKKDTCGRTFCSIIEDKDGNFRLVKDNICYLSNYDSWEQTATIYELFTKDEASQLIQSIDSNMAYKINYYFYFII